MIRVLSAAALSIGTLTTVATIATAPASATTGTCSLTPTNGSTSVAGTVTRTLGGRMYELHVPAGLTGTQVPLLLSLHGAGSDGYQDELSTGWSQFVDGHNAIVAYPDATGPQSGVWNPYSSNSPDVTFVRQVAADISATWCIDPSRIYVDGWSNGAVMSERMACDAPDLIAAGTSYAGGDPTIAGTACRPSRPISFGVIAGNADFTYSTLAQNGAQWAGWDNCALTTTPSSDAYGSAVRYNNCPNGNQVWVRTVNNTSHNWPSGAQGVDQRNQMWSFYMAHPKA